MTGLWNPSVSRYGLSAAGDIAQNGGWKFFSDLLFGQPGQAAKTFSNTVGGIWNKITGTTIAAGASSVAGTIGQNQLGRKVGIGGLTQTLPDIVSGISTAISSFFNNIFGGGAGGTTRAGQPLPATTGPTPAAGGPTGTFYRSAAEPAGVSPQATGKNTVAPALAPTTPAATAVATIPYTP